MMMILLLANEGGQKKEKREEKKKKQCTARDEKRINGTDVSWPACRPACGAACIFHGPLPRTPERRRHHIWRFDARRESAGGREIAASTGGKR
jgi:hypothetical protein